MDSLWIGLDDLDLEETLGDRLTDRLGDAELLRAGDFSCFPFNFGAKSSSLLEIAAVDTINLSVGGEFDLLRDLRGDRDLDLDLDLLTGEAVRLETLEIFLSCLKRLSTLFLLRFGLLSFLILEISFCSSRVFFCNSLTLSSWDFAISFIFSRINFSSLNTLAFI